MIQGTFEIKEVFGNYHCVGGASLPSSVKSIKVETDNYGKLRGKLFLKGGGYTVIPIGRDSKLKEGDVCNYEELCVVYLQKFANGDIKNVLQEKSLPLEVYNFDTDETETYIWDNNKLVKQ